LQHDSRLQDEKRDDRLAEQRDLFVFAHGLQRFERIALRGLGRGLRRLIGLDRLRRFRSFRRRLRWRRNELGPRQHGGLRPGRRRRHRIEQVRGRVGFGLGFEQEIGRIDIGFRGLRGDRGVG